MPRIARLNERSKEADLQTELKKSSYKTNFSVVASSIVLTIFALG